MSGPCREADLEARLTGELSASAAERVDAHVAACAHCTRLLAWLRLERGWMAQRARREPARPALRFEALEARLRSTPPRPPHRAGARLRLALGTVAAVACGVLALMLPTSTAPLSEEPWGEGLISVAQVEACTDPSLEAVARVEARVGACLLASPARTLSP